MASIVDRRSADWQVCVGIDFGDTLCRYEDTTWSSCGEAHSDAPRSPPKSLRTVHTEHGREGRERVDC